MSQTSPRGDAPLGVGLTSLVFGAVGVLLFFMPILGIPLAGIGVVFGLAGVALVLPRGWSSLRWPIAGLVVSGAALAVGLAIAEAPAGSSWSRTIPLDSQPVRETPYVSPPARPGE
jgi:hypothetical protein